MVVPSAGAASIGHGARIVSQSTNRHLLTKHKGAFMFEGLFQPMHLLVIFGIALLVFGPKKLPELGKGIGEGIRGFKSAMKEQAEEKPATIVAPDQSTSKG
jgi:sec-independent protein translocase protein TatA